MSFSSRIEFSRRSMSDYVPAEMTIEGWLTLNGLRVRVCCNGEIMDEYTLNVARSVAEDILSDPAPVLSRENADRLAHDILAVCDALTR